MKRGKIARAIDYLDEELIADALENTRTEKTAQSTAREKSGRTGRGKVWGRVAAIAAAVAVLVTGGIVVSKLVSVDAGVSLVALDVNPSLEIEVNDKEKVVEVHALNQEAKDVVQGMDLKKSRLDEAMDKIIAAMVQKGYLTNEQNSILISVDTHDTKTAIALKKNVSERVSARLEDGKIAASVITQSFTKENIKDKAAKDGISAAKATLVEKLVSSGMADAYGIPYKYEDLLELKVNELKMIFESKSHVVRGIETKGEAGKGEFISQAQALQIAYTDAGVAETDIEEREVEMDFDKQSKTMSYEIEFETRTTEYEYEIDAKTGAILEKETDSADEEDEEISLPEGCLTEDEVLAIAYDITRLTADMVAEHSVDLRMKRGCYVYAVELEVNDDEYHLIIDAQSGRLYSYYEEKAHGWGD